jgi:hypothetical protein
MRNGMPWFNRSLPRKLEVANPSGIQCASVYATRPVLIKEKEAHLLVYE